MWQCLYLQRLCPLSVFSYFAVLGTFLGVSLWAVVCSPQPITACWVWGSGLYKNVETSYQIVSTWDHQKRSYTLFLIYSAKRDLCEYWAHWIRKSSPCLSKINMDAVRGAVCLTFKCRSDNLKIHFLNICFKQVNSLEVTPDRSMIAAAGWLRSLLLISHISASA